MIEMPVQIQPANASAVPAPRIGSMTSGSRRRRLTNRAAARRSTSTRISPSRYAWTNSACVIDADLPELQTHARNPSAIHFAHDELDAPDFEAIADNGTLPED